MEKFNKLDLIQRVILDYRLLLHSKLKVNYQTKERKCVI